jgi:hypothetical protein
MCAPASLYCPSVAGRCLFILPLAGRELRSLGRRLNGGWLRPFHLQKLGS